MTSSTTKHKPSGFTAHSFLIRPHSTPAHTLTLHVHNGRSSPLPGGRHTPSFNLQTHRPGVSNSAI